MYDFIGVCFDMAGCPNNCRHCWIKSEAKGFIKEDQVRHFSDAFKKYTSDLEVYTWYLEPDYLPNYKALFQLENDLSTTIHGHFELLSDYRLVRDPDYVKWAYEIGLRKCQLTFFGQEENTNYFTGRNNAFQELIQSAHLLIDHKIAPRIQLFLYHNTVDDINAFIDSKILKDIKNRCDKANLEFEMFGHTGSCMGAASDLYNNWLREEDLSKISSDLIQDTMKHYDCRELEVFLGHSEKDLIQMLKDDETIRNHNIDKIILYVDGKLDVYPHFAVQKPWWKIGNLNDHEPDSLLEKYMSYDVLAYDFIIGITIGEVVSKYGDKSSTRMFDKDDYLDFLYEKHFESMYEDYIRTEELLNL